MGVFKKGVKRPSKKIVKQPTHQTMFSIYYLDAIIQSRPISAVYKTANEAFDNQYLMHYLSENYSVYKTIADIAPSKVNSIFAAHWAINLKNSETFEPIFTEEGFCFTYNSINSREIYANE